MNQETNQNDYLISSFDKNSFTGIPNKRQGKEKQISVVNRKISNINLQLESEKDHTYPPAPPQLSQIPSTPPVAAPPRHPTEK